jgi:hypothetical protein
MDNPASECWSLFGRNVKVADTFLIAFTALLALATLLLWWSTERLVAGAEDSSVRQLRAYVEASPSFVEGLRNNASVEVKLTYVNHGLTPAEKMIVSGQVEVLPYPLPHDFELPATSGTESLQQGNLFPNAPFNGWLPQAKPIDPQTKAEILLPTPKWALYVHGSITYLDVFTKTRRTDFCFYLDPESMERDESGALPNSNEGMNIQFAPCTGHNDLS